MDTLLNLLLIGVLLLVCVCGALAMLEIARIFDFRTWFKNKWRSWYG